MADLLAYGGLGALFGAAAALGVVVLIGLYVYMALAWSTIARKLNYEYDWLAWIPIAQLVLLPVLAEKDWTWVFMFLVPIANIVFYFIWMWKILERRNLHGALSLVPIAGVIPYIGGLASIANLVILGIAAWRD